MEYIPSFSIIDIYKAMQLGKTSKRCNKKQRMVFNQELIISRSFAKFLDEAFAAKE
jgi:hypothetical protein